MNNSNDYMEWYTYISDKIEDDSVELSSCTLDGKNYKLDEKKALKAELDKDMNIGKVMELIEGILENDPVGKNKENISIKEQLDTNKCKCNIHDLMNNGCKCGGK